LDEITMPPNEAGEITVSGDHVLASYLNGQGDEETKFLVDGSVWHRTGDAGYLDSAGRLWLLGRLAAKMTDGSGTLYPFAVECVAHQFDWVRRAGCVSANEGRWLALQVGRRPSKAEFQELLSALEWARLRGSLIFAKLPVDRRHNAKIDYVALRNLVMREAAHQGKPGTFCRRSSCE
jgi:acyl-CoA synthetase (AMP-forming)/AMP-acid ligase II